MLCAYSCPCFTPFSFALPSPSSNISSTAFHRLVPTLLIPSTMEDRICFPTLSQSTLSIPSTKAENISGIMASSCGSAWTTPFTSASNSWIPAKIILGRFCTIPVTSVRMITGAAEINMGIALISPCPIPALNWIPALISCGIFCNSDWTIVRIICSAIGTSVGSCCAIPVTRLAMICTPPEIMAGMLAVIACKRF